LPAAPTASNSCAWRKPPLGRLGSVGLARCGLLGEPGGKVIPTDCRLLLPCPRPWRSRPCLDLAIAQDEHVRDLLLLREADLVLHPVRGLVDLDPHSTGTQNLSQTRGRLVVAIGDRDDDGLNRRAPERERAREVLRDDTDE